MADVRTKYEAKGSPLSETDLATFVDSLKGAADHSLDIRHINQLPGFQRLSEEDQALVTQRAGEQKADRVLRQLEDEWKRWSFDHLIAPKFETDSRLKYQADGAFYSLLQLASQRKWDTLETFLRTATTAGLSEARKQWRHHERYPLSGLVWSILWEVLEAALIVVLLAYTKPGFAAVLISVLVLVYIALSSQISEVGHLIFLSLAASAESLDEEASEEQLININRNLSGQTQRLWIRKVALAITEVIAIVTLVARGLL